MKKAVSIIAVILLSAVLCTTVFGAAGTWHQDEFGWWFQNEDGSYPADQWKEIDGSWYHFNGAGYMETGWIMFDGFWYFLYQSGAMAKGWIFDGNWYYLNAYGVMVTGWLEDGGKKYFLDRSGAMVTGNQVIDGVTYYFDESGALVSTEPDPAYVKEETSTQMPASPTGGPGSNPANTTGQNGSPLSPGEQANAQKNPAQQQNAPAQQQNSTQQQYSESQLRLLELLGVDTTQYTSNQTNNYGPSSAANTASNPGYNNSPVNQTYVPSNVPANQSPGNPPYGGGNVSSLAGPGATLEGQENAKGGTKAYTGKAPYEANQQTSNLTTPENTASTK